MYRVACAMFVLLAGCAAHEAHAQQGFSLSVAGLDREAEVPQQYTCMGEGGSPPIAWSDVPQGARSMALVVDDPDAPRGTFTHWLVYGVSPDAGVIDPGQPKYRELASGAKQGDNDYGHVGWGPPCPPPGRAHRYRFTLYALDDDPRLPPGADRHALERAIRGHVVAEDSITLRYAR